MEQYKLSECTFLEIFKNIHNFDGLPVPQKLTRLQQFACSCYKNCSLYDDCTRQDDEIAALKNELQKK
ncbi:MAG: hypothetical protein LBQ05_01950 [Christensenellaceae bacterium]|nr:hypothetical protein [Christensenellaceae bacterium]